MITTLMPTPKQQFLAIAGIPLVGGRLYTYASGTTTPKATYIDPAGTESQPNPIILNARGEPPTAIFWSGNYRIELRDALGNLIYTVDNFDSSSALTALATAGGAAMIGYGATNIADFLKNSNAIVVNTVADLIALDSKFFTRALVLGYYFPGDGGGGLYFKMTTVPTAANGGSILLATDLAYWQLSQQGTISVRQFGARGDGVSDDTNAINAALSSGVQIVRVPFSSTGYLIAGMITLPAYTSLIGDEVRIPVGAYSNGKSGYESGVNLIMTATVTTAGVLMSGNNAISGIRFYYPNQTDTNPPVVYPPTILGLAGAYDVTISKCSFPNSYDSIRFNNNHGRIRIEDCESWAMRYDIDFDNHYDVSFIDRVNIWPIRPNYKTTAGSAYEYTMQSGEGLRLGRMDHIIVSNFFIIFKGIGIHTYQGANGNTYGAFTNIGVESCIACIKIDAVNSENGLSFTNSKFCISIGAPLITSGYNVLWNTGAGRVQFNGCNFWGGLVQNHIYAQPSGGQLLVSNTTFTGGLSGTGGAHLKLTNAIVASISSSSFGPHPIQNLDLNALTHDLICTGNIVPTGGLVTFNPNNRVLIGAATNMPA